MNSLDVILVVVVLAYAISGLIQGFVVNLVSTIGLVVGGLLAVAFVPRLLGDGPTSLTTSLLALALVVGAAACGQAIGTYVGTDLRGVLKSEPARWIDALGGAALSVAAVLVASWALGYAISGSQIPYLSGAVRDSTVLRKVDGVMPAEANRALRSFTQVLDSNLFPRYIDPFQAEEITAVSPPDPATLNLPGVKSARASVVKILGLAKCDRGIEGTGFQYAPGRVMTNAHVVAGVDEPYIDRNGERTEARVVLFDPELDIAVLDVGNLGLEPLEFDLGGKSGEDAAVLGYPQNGPFDARAARIRERLTLRSPDIYDRGQVLRDVFAVRGLVRSGNSGGPLVSAEGDVVGVIFAASIADKATGYALTAEAVAKDAEKGRTATQRVSTGDCA